MRQPLTRALAALPLVVVLGLTGCGGDADDPADANGPDDVAAPPAADAGAEGDTVRVEGFRFQPSSLEVTVGTTVTWSNADAIDHTATAGTPDAPEEGAFDLDMPEQGTTVSQTFDEAGTFAYFCRVHESMRGEITVSG